MSKPSSFKKNPSVGLFLWCREAARSAPSSPRGPCGAVLSTPPSPAQPEGEPLLDASLGFWPPAQGQHHRGLESGAMQVGWLHLVDQGKREPSGSWNVPTQILQNEIVTN